MEIRTDDQGNIKDADGINLNNSDMELEPNKTYELIAVEAFPDDPTITERASKGCDWDDESDAFWASMIEIRFSDLQSLVGMKEPGEIDRRHFETPELKVAQIGAICWNWLKRKYKENNDEDNNQS